MSIPTAYSASPCNADETPLISMSIPTARTPLFSMRASQIACVALPCTVDDVTQQNSASQIEVRWFQKKLFLSTGERFLPTDNNFSLPCTAEKALNIKRHDQQQGCVSSLDYHRRELMCAGWSRDSFDWSKTIACVCASWCLFLTLLAAIS